MSEPQPPSNGADRIEAHATAPPVEDPPKDLEADGVPEPDPPEPEPDPVTEPEPGVPETDSSEEAVEGQAISYCYGRSATDSYPAPRTASDFEVFADQILALPRARTRETRTYICGPMRLNGDGHSHRGKADLLPRSWLALDLDGGSREECDLMLLRLADYLAVAWTTARSTPEYPPRVRILVALNGLVDGPEGEHGSASPSRA